MMELTEDLYKTVAQEVLGTTKITYQDEEIEFRSAVGKNDNA